jgi:hypothetical protein
VTPKPPATGNDGPNGSGGTSQAAPWLLTIGGLLLFTIGLRLAQRRSSCEGARTTTVRR